jgi:hypothetical protein
MRCVPKPVLIRPVSHVGATGGDPRFAIQRDSKVTIHFKDVTPSAVAKLLKDLGGV